MGSSRSSKIVLVFMLLCVDIAMNCSFDYDSLGFSDQVDFLVVVLGVQIVIEISIFLALFLAMAETFLFRVGLLGLLIKKFRFVLLVHPVYLALTLAAGALRVRKLADGDIVSLQQDSMFVIISIIHKLVAVLYYVVNMRATMKLGSSLYFDRSLWVSLVNENKNMIS